MNDSALAVKHRVAHAALRFVVPGQVLGVGSGSTVDCFIDALAGSGIAVAGAVAASERSARRLDAAGVRVIDLNEVDVLATYVDGADEVDPALNLVKGGGAALTREKIIAAVATSFVCIVDERKQVDVLGRFPLPIEIIAMAQNHVMRTLRALGGDPVPRTGVLTDNGHPIIDVHGLRISDPPALERTLDAIAGVVSHGIFAARGADVLLIGATDGVREARRDAPVPVR